MKCSNLVFVCALATLATAVGAANGHSSDSAEAYYYYPAPRGNHIQFREIPLTQVVGYEYPAAARSLYESRRPQQHVARRYPTQPQPQYAYQQLFRQLLRPHAADAIVEQFVQPALENAAFRMALTSQGYAVRPPTAEEASFSPSMDVRSLNVKLPVPIGLTPLNNAPLPLQEGASFASLPRDVTSYGTRHPLRRRR